MGSKQEVERTGKRRIFMFFIAKTFVFSVLIFTLIYKITRVSNLKKILTGAENRLMSQKFLFKCKRFTDEH